MEFIERPEKLDFPLTKGLDWRGVIYIPSTINKDKKIPDSEFIRRINKVARNISEIYGGDTVQRMAIGNWFDDKGKFVSENIARIEFFTNKENYLKNDSNLGQLIYNLANLWGQDSISFELKTSENANELHFIPKKMSEFKNMIYHKKLQNVT